MAAPAIALNSLAPPSPPASNSGPIVQPALPLPPSSNTPPSPATGVSSPASQAQSPSSPSPSSDLQPTTSSSSFRIRCPSLKTSVAAVTFVLGLIGIALAFGTGIPTLRLAKWSGRNDFLQSCLAAAQAGLIREQCNKTIEAGPVPPPFFKRDTADLDLVIPISQTAYKIAEGSWETLYSRPILGLGPLMTPMAVLFLMAIGIASLVYTRPRMQPFPQNDSVVRMCPVHVYMALPVTDDTGHASQKFYRTSRRMRSGLHELHYSDHHIEEVLENASGNDTDGWSENPSASTGHLGRPTRVVEGNATAFDDESQREERSSAIETKKPRDAVARAARIEDMFRYQCARYAQERHTRELTALSRDSVNTTSDDEFERNWGAIILEGVRDMERAHAQAEDAKRGIPGHERVTEPYEEHILAWLNNVSAPPMKTPSTVVTVLDETQHDSLRLWDKDLNRSDEPISRATRGYEQEYSSTNGAELIFEPRDSDLSPQALRFTAQSFRKRRHSRERSYRKLHTVMAAS